MKTTDRKLTTEWANRIEQKPIDWLWRPWLARGVITVVDGEQGVGKSSLLFDVIARVTTGRAFPQFDETADERPRPDGDAGRADTAGAAATVRAPGQVLLLALDDPVDSVVAPRLAAAGAELANVAIADQANFPRWRLQLLTSLAAGKYDKLHVDPKSENDFMPTIEISRQNLLDAVKQMAPEDFDVFIERALSLRAQPKAPTLSARETKLISRINRGLPEELSKRYGQLTQRLKKKLLAADEHRELLELTREAESRDADRAEALLELAKLRRVPLRILMKQMGIESPPANG